MKTRGVNIGGGGHIAKEIGDNILDAVVDEFVSNAADDALDYEANGNNEIDNEP